MATREERMRDRMRGAGRHNVGDIDFGFVIPVAEEPADEPAGPPATEPLPPLAPAPTARPSPNTSAKRKRLETLPTTDHDVYSLPDHSTEAGETTQAPPSTHLSQSPSLPAHPDRETEDHPMTDAPPLPLPTIVTTTTTTYPPHPRGPLSSVISATKRLSFDPSSPPTSRSRKTQSEQFPPEEMEVTESPADAPGSGRRRPLRMGPGTPVVGSSALLQKVLAEEDGDGSSLAQPQLAGNSSPIERRVARRKSGVIGRGRGRGRGGMAVGKRTGRVSGSSVAESEAGFVEGVEAEVAGEKEEVVQVDEDQDAEGESEIPVEEEQQEQEEQEEEVAQEVGEQEAAQRLGRKRRRRSLPAPSPELGSGVTEESPAPKRRRRRDAASPAQQQQPAKKARGRPPAKAQPQPQPEPSPQPQRQPQPRPKTKPRKQTVRKSKGAEDEAEKPTGTVPVTVHRFSKASQVADGEHEQDADRNGDIPFANRGGVNAIDVLSKLCEELIEAYMDKLEERARAAEDAATRREQKTMYRALEAFQEELRTRLLEHTIALDTLHALRKRVRAAQKEKLTLRDDILRIRAEREQVALRMDAIRIRHEADSKEALRHISLSSTMHDIDLAVEKGQAAPELSPAEQKKADLANLELLISRVADQACTRSDGGGTLKQIREFNAFLERAAAVLEGR